VDTVVREFAARAGELELNAKDVQQTVSEAVKQAVKEAVKDVMEEAVENGGGGAR
jgi:histone H3/H4